VTAVQAAWTDVDRKVRQLGSISTHDATDVVAHSLTRVAVALELAEQQLTSIRDQLAQQVTEHVGTSE
jgi:hypothetical protein